jgi:hypothetical protein
MDNYIIKELKEINYKISKIDSKLAVHAEKFSNVEDMMVKVNTLESIKYKGEGFKIAATFAATLITLIIVFSGAAYEYAKSVPSPKQQEIIESLQNSKV